ncbi:hypothetical protein Syun_000266 [Stephania yunnanensis]|uniref:Clp R domain-containing protein n=1 Tax=Stephania yunnanensis TaxID=152371 RepID=A0AAP0LBT3_9MAGN
MPTAVSTARECLTAEAARALDEAAAIASRRGHPQTTSLHLVSALLPPPSSAPTTALRRSPTSKPSTSPSPTPSTASPPTPHRTLRPLHP